jgi:hypothetical protein
MPNQPQPSRLPDDPPSSQDEKNGVDNGPCGSFSRSAAPWERVCRNGGYGHS